MVESEPTASSWKYMFIQCAGCGGVVGVVDYFNIGHMLQKLGKALKIDL
jgi:hypothetical protein